MSSTEFQLLDSQKEAILQLVKTLGYTAPDFRFDRKPYFADSRILADTLIFKNITYCFTQFVWLGDKLDMLIYPSKLGFFYTRATYQHWTEGFILFKQWLNTFEGLIQQVQKNGFTMNEFYFHLLPEKPIPLKVTYQRNGYYFEIGDNEKRKKITYHPGETSSVEVVEQPLLTEFDYFAKWLTRLKSELNTAQNLTNAALKAVLAAKAEPTLPASSPSREPGNPVSRKFDSEQFNLVLSRVQYLRAALVKLKLHGVASSEQVKQANRELDYLVDSANRVTPYDWSYIACTALNIIANILKVNAIQEDELFKGIREFIQHLPRIYKPRIVFLPEEKTTEPSLQYQNPTPLQEQNKPAPTFI